MKKQELITKIHDVFSNVSYIGDENIVYDNSTENYDCIELKEAFSGKKWQDLDHNFIFNHKDELSFFSTIGLKYYLPAFMIDILNDFEDSDTLADNLIVDLILPLEIDNLLMANEIKKCLLDEKMPEIDFNNILQQELRNTENRLYNFLEWVKLFSKEQKEVIYLFLEYLDDNFSEEFLDIKSPKIAINRYWFKYKNK